VFRPFSYSILIFPLYLQGQVAPMQPMGHPPSKYMLPGPFPTPTQAAPQVHPPLPPGPLPVPPPDALPGFGMPERPMGFQEGLRQPPTEAQITHDHILRVLDFWFGFLSGPDYFPNDKLEVWLANTPEVERQIRMQFSQDVANAERGEYNHWRETPQGRLALILLLDQITRHLYRNRPQAFALDRMARAVVLEGIRKGDDKELYPIERAFFYLPLEHAEDMELQNLSVNLYRQLALQSPEAIRMQMYDVYQSALMHHQQISRFGRFPHRNAVLGRETTPDETAFLKQQGGF